MLNTFTKTHYHYQLFDTHSDFDSHVRTKHTLSSQALSPHRSRKFPYIREEEEKGLMEESSIDDYSDYLTTYSVRSYPTVGEDNAPFACAASSTHVHVRFSYHTVDDSDDGEYEVESRIICLRDEMLAEESGDDCRSLIFSEGLCYWPIDAGTVLDIADEVVQKALQFKRNLRVDIRSVQIRGGSDDVQEMLTYEDDDDRDFGGADGGCVDIKSLKRKRIAYDERDCCCVICLEVLTARTDVGVMPCSHYSFHHHCLSSWLERSPSCPLCRRM